MVSALVPIGSWTSNRHKSVLDDATVLNGSSDTVAAASISRVLQLGALEIAERGRQLDLIVPGTALHGVKVVPR